MNKKIIVIIVVIVLIFIGALYTMLQKPKDQPVINQENNNQATQQNIMDTQNTQDAQGLKIETLVEGSGSAQAKDGDKVTVNYTGTLTDGTKFDSSLNPGRTPFQFTIGPNCQLDGTCVIKGWDLGVTGMKVGQKVKLTIPSDLAYGPAGRPPVIPPNATLIFEIDLLKIN